MSMFSTDITKAARALRAAERATKIIGVIGLLTTAILLITAASAPPEEVLSRILAAGVVLTAIVPLCYYSLKSFRVSLGYAAAAIFVAPFVLLALLAFVRGVRSVLEAIEPCCRAIPENAGISMPVPPGIQALLYFGVVVTSGLLVPPIVLNAPRLASQLNRRTRHATRPLPPTKSFLMLCWRIVGGAPKVKRTWWKALLGNCCYFISALTNILGITTLAGVSYCLLLWIGVSLALRSFYVSEGPLSLGLLALLFGVGLCLGAQKLRSFARRMSRQSYEEQMRNDHRAPILFLRPFFDDQVTLPRGNIILDVLGAEPGNRKLDHLLVERFGEFGPIIAIGRPGETDIPFGAARTYVSDSEWQLQVRALAEASAHVVLVSGSSPGVAWEMETFLSSGFGHKTLLLALPADDIASNPLLPNHLLQGIGAQTIGPALRLFGIYQTAKGTQRVLVRKASAAAYQTTLLAFFRREYLGAEGNLN